MRICIALDEQTSDRTHIHYEDDHYGRIGAQIVYHSDAYCTGLRPAVSQSQFKTLYAQWESSKYAGLGLDEFLKRMFNL